MPFHIESILGNRSIYFWLIGSITSLQQCHHPITKLVVSLLTPELIFVRVTESMLYSFQTHKYVLIVYSDEIGIITNQVLQVNKSNLALFCYQ